MEPMDLEEAGFTVERTRRTTASGGGGTARCVVLRRYSLTICLVEALAILIFFVYLLVWKPPTQLADSTACAPHSGPGFRNSSSAKQQAFNVNNNLILLDLIPECNQRRHDLALAIVCKSAQADQCGGGVESSAAAAAAAGQVVVVVDDGDNNKLKENKRSKRIATIVVTSKAGQRLEKRQVELSEVDCHTARSKCLFKTRLRVFKFQNKRHLAGPKIIGWGGALSDSSIGTILSLTTNGTKRLLDDYFGRDGLMFNMVRVTIGGSDFSPRLYTNDDNDDNATSGEPDLKLAKFHLTEEDILYKIPILKLIQRDYGAKLWPNKRDVASGGGLKLFASMWSPPAWMKTNNHFNKGQLRGSIDDEPREHNGYTNITRDELYYNALAELKVRFLQAYQAESIKFWGLTVMNEPVFATQPFLDFNTMIFPARDYANYVAKYLGPKIKNNPALKHIKLIAHDDNRRYLKHFTWPILDQKRVEQFIDGVSVHGYVDEQYNLIEETYLKYRSNFPVPYSTSTSSLKLPPDDEFFVLPTELCSGHLPFMAKALVGNWHRGVHYALDIIRSLQSMAAGWIDWNMALDLRGGPGWLGGRLDAPIIVDKSQDLYYKSPMFYAIGHFSRYIPPGSFKLSSKTLNTQYDHQLETVTFALAPPTPPVGGGDGDKLDKLATVILNNNPYLIEIYLQVVGEPSGVGKSNLSNDDDGENNEEESKVNAPYYRVECPPDSIMTIIY